jgi:hypothetical protein
MRSAAVRCATRPAIGLCERVDGRGLGTPATVSVEVGDG